MPTVRRLDGPTVQQSALPNARVQGGNTSLETFGGGEAVERMQRTNGRFIDRANEVFAREKQKADELRFLDADMQASQIQTELEIEAKKMRGKDSAGASQFVGDEWTKRTDKLMEGLADENQRAMVQKALIIRRGNLDKVVQYHTADEMDKYDAETTESYLKNARNEALLNYKDPERIELSLVQQHGAIAKRLMRKGMDPNSDEGKLEMAKATSLTHASVIDRMLQNGEDLGAKQYFEKNKHSITDAEVVTKLEGAMKTATVLGETQRQASAIMKDYKDIGSALTAAREIQDPTIQKETVQELKVRFAEREAIKKDQEERRFKGASDIVEKTKARPNAVIWDRLSLSERNALDSRIEQLRKGIPPETNWDKYYELRKLAVDPEKKSIFLGTNLSVYRPEMADTEFKQLIDLQTAMREGKPSKELDGIRTNKQIIDQTLSAFDIDPSAKPGSDDAIKVNQFYKLMDDWAAQEQAAGKKVSNQDVQAKAKSLMIEGVTQKNWIFPNKTKRAFELAPNEEFHEIVIPDEDREAIINELRSRGRPTTEQEINKWYLRGKSRGI